MKSRSAQQLAQARLDAGDTDAAREALAQADPSHLSEAEAQQREALEQALSAASNLGA